MNDRAIIQMNVIDVREASGKSNNMERIGFQKGMDALLASPMIVKEVVTDGHLEIAALMSKVFTMLAAYAIMRTPLVYYI